MTWGKFLTSAPRFPHLSSGGHRALLWDCRRLNKATDKSTGRKPWHTVNPRKWQLSWALSFKSFTRARKADLVTCPQWPPRTAPKGSLAMSLFKKIPAFFHRLFLGLYALDTQPTRPPQLLCRTCLCRVGSTGTERFQLDLENLRCLEAINHVLQGTLRINHVLWGTRSTLERKVCARVFLEPDLLQGLGDHRSGSWGRQGWHLKALGKGGIESMRKRQKSS